MDFCGGGVLISEEGVIVDNSEREGWMNPLDLDKLAACSKQRDVQASTFEVVLIVQFDNPTESPVELSEFAMTFATDGEDVLAECVPGSAAEPRRPPCGRQRGWSWTVHSSTTSVGGGHGRRRWVRDTFAVKHCCSGRTASGSANLR